MPNVDVTRVREICTLLYGPEIAPGVVTRITSLVSQFAPRLDGLPGVEVDQTAAMLITYADMVRDGDRPPLRVLRECLSEQISGVIDWVHLLPFFPWTSDDGFAVRDYLAVDERIGSWSDVEALGEDCALAFDAVVNHVSAESAWFQAFLAGDPAVERFFCQASPEEDLSAVVRPRSLPLLTRVETAKGPRHVWTTFSADQVDLDYREPEVLLRVLEILLEYFARGARIIRLDAIAFLWKRIGTSCLHLPETHAVVRLIRLLAEALLPGSVILTETNVPHAENVSYFGTQSDEAQMVYQFPLPVLTAHALARGDGSWLRAWAASLAAPPAGCAFLNFLASHDGVGVRPATGLLPATEIRWLCERVVELGGLVSTKTNPDGSDSPYELNINYLDLVGGELPEPEATDALVVAHSILMTMPGVPAIYFHSLFGSRGDHQGVRTTGRARSINREKLDWPTLRDELSQPGHRRARVFGRLREMLVSRREQPALHPAAACVIPASDPELFVIERTADDGALLAVHNVSGEPARFELPAAWHRAQDISTGETHGGEVALRPRSFVWLRPARP